MGTNDSYQLDQLDSGTYVVRYRTGGKLVRKSLKTKVLGEAKKRRDEILAQVPEYAYLDQRDGVYWIRYPAGESLIERSLGTGSIRAAQKRRDRIIVVVDMALMGVPAKTVTKAMLNQIAASPEAKAIVHGLSALWSVVGPRDDRFLAAIAALDVGELRFARELIERELADAHRAE